MEIKRTSKKSASVKVSFIEDNENLIPKKKKKIPVNRKFSFKQNFEESNL